MQSKATTLLQYFKNSPDLKINSEAYPFENFKFSDEKITESEFVFPKNSVLGMQAEACFEAYLKQSKNYELLAANIQINGEIETLGELDYIVRNLKTEEIVHIELACKFYLYEQNADTSEEEKWIGPNRKDTLFDKLEKLKLKQFPLLYKDETIQKLQTLHIEIPTSQQLCLKTFLFLPKKMSAEKFPKAFHDCIVGYYINSSHFEKDETALYAIPNKKEWLLPIDEMNNWHTFSETKQLIETQLKIKKSPLIYKKTPHNIERFFIIWW
ncbi:protein of unknown function (DUF1853) [Aequorivita sublithincola DSM 14238]|uniref:DUF1853 domain-containing protein n=1 Tax=Aequorivita sublithincola (strain DSM 14238 / LMG 21431 / ACAM 643 / 9-3) TaxID=746697 RepID=I3YSA2_AEQSU|nr:DUF1853 family protein [Aequorivita sublithincola]AFL79870.1 protein of unknown function (DUF1853) [Aequorivita sublithincola DSM 14238]